MQKDTRKRNAGLFALWTPPEDYWLRPYGSLLFLADVAVVIAASTYGMCLSASQIDWLLFRQFDPILYTYGVWAQDEWARMFGFAAALYLLRSVPFLVNAIILYDHDEKKGDQRKKAARARDLKKWEKKSADARGYYTDRVFQSIKPLKPPGFWTPEREHWTGSKSKSVLPYLAGNLISVIYILSWFLKVTPRDLSLLEAVEWSFIISLACIFLFLSVPFLVNVFFLRMRVIIEERNKKTKQVPTKDVDVGRE